jgi:hypothetical protein
MLGKYGESEEARKNVDLVRRIAALYEQKGDLRTALEWYRYTSELMHHTDPAAARKAAEIELKLLDQSIAEFETWIEQYGAAEGSDEVRKQLDELKKRKVEALLADAHLPTAVFEMKGRIVFP